MIDLPAAPLPEGPPWPVLVFLHGAGEVGNDLRMLRRHGPPKLVAAGRRLPFLVVSPQSPRGGWDVPGLDERLDRVLAEQPADPERVYLTGLSMGGFGSWAWAASRPERFAAVVPICGGGNPAWAPRLLGLPIRVYHGARDRIVPPAYSEEMVDALRALGAEVEFTLYPDAEHDSWTRTYAEPGLYDWMLGHRRRARPGS